jgi:predicted lipid-binding transport protein (Tim44 family)
MSLFDALWIVVAAGAVGGLINAFVSNNGDIILPRPVKDAQNNNLTFRPGFVGNIVVGAFAAGVNWGLYGPFTNEFVFGGAELPEPVQIGLTLAALATAGLVGFAGARWLTNEVDKKLLQAAAATAAAKPSDEARAGEIAMAAPAEAFSIAQRM